MDTLLNTSAACSLKATDSIIRTAIIPTIQTVTINAFFIFLYLLFMDYREVFSFLKSGYQI